MGWSFAMSTSFGKKECVAQLRNPGRFAMGTQILKSSVRGNHHWYLAETHGTKWIGLDLLAGGGKTQGWGYKSMDEASCPYYYDCPLSYLDAASAPVGYGAEWREKVRAYWINKKQRAFFTPGLVVAHGKAQYRLVSSFGARSGWLVTDTGTGAQYHMNTKQLASATVVS